MQNDKTLKLIQAQVKFIPNGWRLDTVGSALNIRNTFRKPISQEVRSGIPGEYPYYGPTKIQDYISDYEQDGTYALIGEDGDHFLKYSTMSQTQYISGKCTVNNHAHIIESSPECDSQWFYVFFKHRNITNFLSRQGAGRFKLNKATLEKLPLLVPPLPEQQKIAKILSTWDKAISTTERLIDNSKQQKKALMQQLLTGKKRLLDDSGKRFEGDWKLSPLKSCVTFMNGMRKPIKQEDRANIQGSYPYYGATGIIDYVEDYIFDDELILLGEDGENILSRALPHVFLITGRSWINNHAHVMKANDGMDSNFLCMYLESLDYRKFNSGSAQPKINKAVCEKIPVLYPALEEQQRISSVLSNADKEIELLEQQLADLKQEKKALMQQLLTGKRRVKVNEPEVA